jgi:hypothetical protein
MASKPLVVGGGPLLIRGVTPRGWLGSGRSVSTSFRDFDPRCETGWAPMQYPPISRTARSNCKVVDVVIGMAGTRNDMYNVRLKT